LSGQEISEEETCHPSHDVTPFHIAMP